MMERTKTNADDDVGTTRAIRKHELAKQMIYCIQDKSDHNVRIAIRECVFAYWGFLAILVLGVFIGIIFG